MYSNHNPLYLVSCVLSGDESALNELIKRHREDRCLLNPRNNQGMPLLQSLIRNDKTDSARLLLDNLDANEVNTQDKLGNTALNEAAKNGNETLVIRLLEKGADRFTKNFDGFKAGMLAEYYKHNEIASRLRPSFILNIVVCFFHLVALFQMNIKINR